MFTNLSSSITTVRPAPNTCPLWVDQRLIFNQPSKKILHCTFNSCLKRISCKQPMYVCFEYLRVILCDSNLVFNFGCTQLIMKLEKMFRGLFAGASTVNKTKNYFFVTNKRRFPLNSKTLFDILRARSSVDGNQKRILFVFVIVCRNI